MLSTGLSSKGTSSDGSCPSPGSSTSTPISTASFSFSFSLPSGPPPESPLKAAPKPSRESSPSPIKGTEGTGSSGSGSPAGLGAGAGLAGATEGAVFPAVALVSMLYFFRPSEVLSLSAYWLYCTGWDVRKDGKFLLPESSNRLSLLIALMILFCLCLCLLLLLLGVAQVFQTNVLMKSTRAPSTHSASKEPQDQIHNMKGCSQRR